MAKENEVLDIRLRLDGEAKERFLEIKAAKNLKNNTDVLRLAINEYFIPVEVSDEDREIIRQDLCDLADMLRKNYKMTVPQIRRFLQQMLSVSI